VLCDIRIGRVHLYSKVQISSLMGARHTVRLKSTITEYKNVYKYGYRDAKVPHNIKYYYSYCKVIERKRYESFGFSSSREAAVALDKKLLDEGHSPINIFKKKV